MIKKGNKVKWIENNTILVGTVEETYLYKISKKIKNNPSASYSNAGMALYIRMQNGKHILKNDTEVIPEP
ncbi:hypothetical protein U6A24_10735 [Aquimarina gracilis]|uniref:Hypervirulence associated protein TUDOR domain-containing protein n=1 Tax=Aquimarina gracilis TaxID=874422 RepID=A0ABU5ZVP3_9FLAO|nr:hypothetical protein [Aquimarina gracilis]MEB3345939.1 hypothetical protein [Aquimarina gracilis]